jgi:predicted lipoprotein with Yx(FWY)xxD motif
MARKSIPQIRARQLDDEFKAEYGRAVRRSALIVLAAAAAVLLAACGSAGSSQASHAGHPATAAKAVVSERSLPGIGTVLVDRSGRTIYSPQQEADGQILCTGSCLSFWFPVPVTQGTQLRGSAGITGVLGTIHAADGLTQLTYDGKPLYTFRLDLAPGQARGNDYTDHFGGAAFTWHAVTVSGSPAAPGPSASPGGYSNQGGSSGY